MKRIKEIKIKNFKAFQQEQSFLLNGKHLLQRFYHLRGTANSLNNGN